MPVFTLRKSIWVLSKGGGASLKTLVITEYKSAYRNIIYQIKEH